MPLARTPDQITARITDIEKDDWLGFAREVLVSVLDYDHAKPYLNDTTTPESWAGQQITDVDAKTRWYYDFALGKIRDHRGISADRSVNKLREYAWLLGADDAIVAMDTASYQNYGAPKVKAFATVMGYDWPAGEELNRMADGLPCDRYCDEGCGR